MSGESMHSARLFFHAEDLLFRPFAASSAIGFAPSR